MKAPSSSVALPWAPWFFAGFSLLPTLALAASDTDTLDTVIVTGSRGSEARTVTSSPAPIDVISAQQLEKTGSGSLRGALEKALPGHSVIPAHPVAGTENCVVGNSPGPVFTMFTL